MKKVFIIHENTKPIRLSFKASTKAIKKTDRYVQLATDFVCCVGYIHTSEEKDSMIGQEYEPVYMYEDADGQPNVELENFIQGVWFETYEEGCKVLTRILKARVENDAKILSTFTELAEKYPEALI